MKPGTSSAPIWLVCSISQCIIEVLEEGIIAPARFGKTQGLHPLHTDLESIGRPLENVHGLRDEVLERHGGRILFHLRSHPFRLPVSADKFHHLHGMALGSDAY